jgi:predicted phage terminase large subunit-like protein
VSTPAVLKPLIYCGSCGVEQSITNFRLLSEEPPIFVDFCGTCEKQFGTLSLYNKHLGSRWVTRRARQLVVSGQDTKAVVLENQALNYREEQTREFARRELARKYLLYYVKQFNPDYKSGWVHKDIARRLEQFVREVEQGLSPRLMIFVPPRHGKSTLASLELPGWVLGLHPEWEVISASYASSLPIGFSRVIKDRLKDPDYQAIFPGTKLRADAQGVEEWFTTKRGRYRAAGVEAGITGTGAHILIIDDPIKDYQEAQSPKVRENAYNWYTSTARTRMAPGGGVLLIQCMTGDTSVLMADGSGKALEHIKVGDAVATYDNGSLSASVVVNWANQGPDYIYAITTTSGTIVKANERHPFLVQRDGVPEWIKLKNLRVGDVIVRVNHSTGENGKGLSAPTKDAANRWSLKAIAARITTKLVGLVACAPHPSIPFRAAPLTLNTDTGSNTPITYGSLKSNADYALSVGSPQAKMSARTGAANFASTTTIAPEKSADCSVTIATSLLDTAKPKTCYSEPLRTCDFILDEIVSIVESGVEDVFDIQVAGTENFIANGLVSHNTRWHDGDLSGLLLSDKQALLEADVPLDEIDNWQVISYPAIAEYDEYLFPDRSIQTAPEVVPEGAILLRHKDDALHPERYTSLELRRIRNTMPSVQWNALFQQNPVPETGEYFTKDMFRTFSALPGAEDDFIWFTAWDLAIGEKAQNDWTVGTVAAYHYSGAIYVMDMVRARMNMYGIITAMMALAKKWPHIQVMGIEQGQIYKTMAPLLNEAIQKEKLKLSLSEELKPVTDKLMRARPLQQKMQMGLVHFPTAQPWVSLVERELLRFPSGTHDDIVDSLAWLIRMSMVLSPPRPQKARNQGRKPESWKKQLVANSGAKSFMTA